MAQAPSECDAEPVSLFWYSLSAGCSLVGYDMSKQLQERVWHSFKLPRSIGKAKSYANEFVLNTKGVIMPLNAQLLHSNMVVHYSTPEYCLCSSDHSVFRFRYDTNSFVKICQLPPKKKGIFGWLKDKIARLYRRFEPAPGIGNLTETPDGTIVIVYDRIYLYKPHAGSHSGIAKPLGAELERLAPPLRNGLAVDPVNNLVYFGEYLNNHSRDIRVIGIDTVTCEVKVCWQFSRQEIKHIHAIIYDAYRKRLWLTTGDNNEESAFYYTDDGFSTVHKFAGGDQSWRAIGILFDETGMEWGMDAGKDAAADEINHIWRWDFASNSRTLRCVIGNPAYAISQLDNGGAILATTFEPGRLQDTPEQAALWYRSPTGEWQQVYSQNYLYRAMPGISKYGMIYIPAGIIPCKNLLFSPVNCQLSHLQLLKINLPSH
ncbi:hypothetical protein QWY20_03085 [Alkalimonas sp. MEB108]|uniref:Uncharacterized protein n=1 Tax=Alkalimonas cellulosilytica TaxID=3058395 RepID=A0ABU7J1S2_9GAMM|nr:hypothetical protein [Alkalimonas sp. MEB108]MEE2000426.1 hypothetical protein [Alkalimonas sp. MEB108]